MKVTRLSALHTGRLYPQEIVTSSTITSSLVLHLIVVRRFEYASDPESYTSGSVATGRASLAGQVTFGAWLCMVLKLGCFGQQIRNTWKVLKCGAGEG
jgi:hypothetical protein